MTSRSRDALGARVRREPRPSAKRAQGMPGALLAPIASRGNEKNHTSIVTTGTPLSPAFPARMVLRFPSRSSRRPGFVASVVGAMQSIVANLAPASGCQNHTTSPSAHASFVRRGHLRPSHPAPNVRDDREAPLLRSAGRGELVKMICPTGIAKFFCEKDWTTQITLNRLMK
jgi:hypothetical protein